MLKFTGEYNVMSNRCELDPIDRDNMSTEERIKYLEERVDALYKSFMYDPVEKVWRYK